MRHNGASYANLHLSPTAAQKTYELEALLFRLRSMSTSATTDKRALLGSEPDICVLSEDGHSPRKQIQVVICEKETSKTYGCYLA